MVCVMELELKARVLIWPDFVVRANTGEKLGIRIYGRAQWSGLAIAKIVTLQKK